MKGYKNYDKSPPISEEMYISLSECRNIECSDLEQFKVMKNLTRINLLGCVNVHDQGVRHLLNNNFWLEEANLGGTSITSEIIDEIVHKAELSLTKVNITGCKKLRNSDMGLL